MKNTTTRKERLLMLEHYYSENLPEKRIDILMLFRQIDNAINWKDSIEYDGSIYDFYDYFKMRFDEEV